MTGPNDLAVDLTLVMQGFETIWDQRQEFLIDGVSIPTARLLLAVVIAPELRTELVSVRVIAAA